MDPWMLTHLRLARARGSLTGPNNRVQDEALIILDMVDEAKAEERRVDEVKALLASVANQERVVDLFPEYFPKDPFEEAYDPETGEFDIDKVDDQSIAWEVPDAEQDADLSAWIAEQERKSGGTTTFTANDWT